MSAPRTGGDLAGRAATVVLVVLAALTIVAASTSLWAQRTLGSTERLVAVTAPVAQQPEVQAALAAYLTDEAVAVLDVGGRVDSTLPGLGSLVEAAAESVVRDLATGAFERYVASSAFAEVWQATVATAHRQTIARWSGDEAATASGPVTVNLLPVLAAALGASEPEVVRVLGRPITVPDLAANSSAEDARQQLSGALGVTLPPGTGEVVLATDAAAAQRWVRVVGAAWLALTAAAVVLLLLLVLLAPRRRKALIALGLGVAVAAAVAALGVGLAPVPATGDPTGGVVAAAVGSALEDSARTWLLITSAVGALFSTAVWLGGVLRGAGEGAAAAR